MEKKLILVIDDSPDILRLITETLKSDYQLKACRNSEEAIAEIESRVPDLILLDIMLPGLSGLEVCSLWRSRGQLLGIPIVAVSAKTGTAIRCQAFEIGFTHYLEKPFDVSELRALVKSLLSLKIAQDKLSMKLEDISLDQDQRILKVNGVRHLLTPKEFDLMLLLMRHEGKIVSRDRILERMDESASLNSDRCIDNFVSNLRKKLKGSKVCIKTHYGAGYEITLAAKGSSVKKEIPAKVS